MADPVTAVAAIAGVLGGGTAAYVAATAIYIGMNVALAFIARKIFAPRVGSGLDEGRKDTVRSNIEARKIVYGRDLVSGPLLFAETTNTNNRTALLQVVLTGHPIQEFEAIYLNDEKLEFAPGDIFGLNDGHAVKAQNFRNEDGEQLVTVVAETGISPIELHGIVSGSSTRQSLVSMNSIVGGTSIDQSTHLAVNCAWVFVSLEYDAEVFSSGLPHIRALIKGKKDIFDPNTGSFGWRDNWALCAADYLKVGFGAEHNEIDWESVKASQDISDEWVKIGKEEDGSDIYSYDQYAELIRSDLEGEEHDGFQVAFQQQEDGRWFCTHQRRYTCNGMLSTLESPMDNLDNILVSATGVVSYTGGLFSVYAAHYVQPEENISIEGKDFIGDGVRVTASQGLANRNNLVSGIFVNAEDFYNNADFPTVVPKVVVDIEEETSMTVVPTTGDADSLYPPSITEIGTVLKVVGDFINPSTGTNYVIFVLQENDFEEGVTASTWVRYLRLEEGSNPYEVEDSDIELEDTIEFGMINDPYRAQRVAKLYLDKGRQAITLEGTLNLKGFQLTPFMNIPVTLPKMGWKDKVFKVIQWEYNDNGSVNIALIEDNERVYQWKQGEAIIGGTRGNTNLGKLPKLMAPESYAAVSSSYYTSEGSMVGQGSVLIKPFSIDESWAGVGYTVDTLKIVRGLYDSEESYAVNSLVRGSGARNGAVGGTSIYISRTSGTLNDPVTSSAHWYQVWIWSLINHAQYQAARAYLDPIDGKFYVLKSGVGNPVIQEDVPPSKDDNLQAVNIASGETWVNHGVYHDDPELIDGTVRIGDQYYPTLYQGFLTPVQVTTNTGYYFFRTKALSSSVARDSDYVFDEVHIKRGDVIAPKPPVGVQLLNLVEQEQGVYENGILIRIDLQGNREVDISHFKIRLEYTTPTSGDSEEIIYPAPSNLDEINTYDIWFPTNIRATFQAFVRIVNQAGAASVPEVSSLAVGPLLEGRLRGVWKHGEEYLPGDIVFLEGPNSGIQLYKMTGNAHVADEDTNKPPNPQFWTPLISGAVTHIGINEPSEFKEGDFWRRTDLNGTITDCVEDSGPPCGTLSVRRGEEWIVIAEAGLDGKSIVELFAFRKAPAGSTPAAPLEGTFNFATNTLSGLTDPWKSGLAALDADDPNPVWASIDFANSQGDPEAEVVMTNWSTPVQVFADGQPGESVNIAFRAHPAGSTPEASGSGSLPSPSGGVRQWRDLAWQAKADKDPEQGDVIWSSVGTRESPDSGWVWNEPVQLEGERGEQGEQGRPGSNGDTLAEVFAFIRDSDNPGNPPNAVFNFDTGNLEFTVSTNWSVIVPTSGSNPVWAAVGIAKNPEGTTYPTDAVPVVWKGTGRAFADGERGDTGDNGVSIDAIFKRSSGQPNPPTATNNPPDPSDGWVTSVNNVGTGDDPIWVSVGRETSPGVWSWDAAVKLEGRDGDQGDQGPPGEPGPSSYTGMGDITFTAIRSGTLTVNWAFDVSGNHSAADCGSTSMNYSRSYSVSGASGGGTGSNTLDIFGTLQISSRFQEGSDPCFSLYKGSASHSFSTSVTKGDTVNISSSVGGAATGYNVSSVTTITATVD